MAHNASKEKSPIKSFVPKQADRLENGNSRIVESVNCGCSLKTFHDNISNLTKPTKYKISQIWPLFRHEYVMSAVASKLERGNRLSNTGAWKGFVRSPSSQHQRKSPMYSDVSMQRDNYVKMSAAKPSSKNGDEDKHKSAVSLRNDYEDSIPMGTVLCTSKGSPCCKEDPHGLESKESNLDRVRCGRKRFNSRSPHRQSDDLYAAVEREFKRLGMYNEREVGVQYDHNKGKLSVTSSPKTLMKDTMDEQEGSECQYKMDCSQHTEWLVDHQSLSPQLHQHALGHHRCDHDQGNGGASLPHHNHTLFHNYKCPSKTDDDDRLSHTSSINQHDEFNVLAPGDVFSASTRILPYNVVESFVSMSNVLCKSHFASLVRKSEASTQRFTSYLIKAKQRAVFRENPSHTPHKHEITASMISSLMPKMKFQSPHHFKYGLQACIGKVIFDHFDTQSYGGEVDLSYKINRQFMFLRAYYVLEALENCSGEQLMEINEDFQQFCHAKLEAIKRRVGWVSRWPSKLLQALLIALKDVWVAHKLAFAFEKPASVFFATEKSSLDLEQMSPLLESSSSKQSCMLSSSSVARTSPRLSPYSNPSPNSSLEKIDDESSFSPKTCPDFESNKANYSKLDMNAGHSSRELIPKHRNLGVNWNGIVEFSVFPGFLISGEGVLPCIVYLQPKAENQHDHHPANSIL
ncbi:hypothetical protein L7F22_064196 [Adiantum nelumboides]|nr:hypothetical protein [Adiantum nelumboides]